MSIKMAKTQNLSLNPTKISGTCGRLMCCLKYEQAAYEDLMKDAPVHGLLRGDARRRRDHHQREHPARKSPGPPGQCAGYAQDLSQQRDPRRPQR
ncbi:MAG: regulatory iron-sulfur-containing complex subunit RicT [Evtepia sp.]